MNAPRTDKSLDNLLKLLANADEPFDEQCVDMDCEDGCEEIAQLAERVAEGEDIKIILPEYARHMDQIECCKEEFEALVNVIQAETDLLNDEETT